MRSISVGWAALAAIACGTTPAHAAEAEASQTITITAQAGAYRSETNSASAVAPTQASLQATQPQSIITREFIEQSVAPTAGGAHRRIQPRRQHRTQPVG